MPSFSFIMNVKVQDKIHLRFFIILSSQSALTLIAIVDSNTHANVPVTGCLIGYRHICDNISSDIPPQMIILNTVTKPDRWQSKSLYNRRTRIKNH